MNARSLAAVALKVWGAILIVSALASLPSAAIASVGTPSADVQAVVVRGPQIGLAIALLLRALVGVGVIAFADRVIGWLVPDGVPLHIEVYASELSALGFALVGLFVLIEGAGNILSAAYTVFTKPSLSTDSMFWYVWEPQRQTIVKAFVQIASGLVLMFGRDAVVNAWWRLRSLAGAGARAASGNP